VALRVRARGERAERAIAEAWAAGAAGAEERAFEGRDELIVYTLAERAEAVRAALVASLGVAAVGRAGPVPEVDWRETWKEGLRPVVISERLVVRPPFAPHPLAPGQIEVVIEPRQAFGTGAHATTALALELLDRELRAVRPGRVLDVGCGSGVLAIAALRLGARTGVACDLDPIAARETRENALRNGVGSALHAFAGSLDALDAPPFDLALANLLRGELVPLLPALVGRLAPGGRLIVAGLLAAELAEIEARLVALGARSSAHRKRVDERGDAWLGLTAIL
jgi:ribosomal protein L11 methyltransferase